MIIFGFRSMVKLLATVNLVCNNCRNPAAQQVVRRMRWFTLFFIPIFPVSVSRTMTCTFCGVTSTLSKQDAEHLAGGTAGGAGGPAPQQQHGQQPPQQGWPQQNAPQQGWPPPGQQPPPPPGGYR